MSSLNQRQNCLRNKHPKTQLHTKIEYVQGQVYGLILDPSFSIFTAFKAPLAISDSHSTLFLCFPKPVAPCS